MGWSGVGTDPTWPRGQRIPVSREGHVTGKSGHASTCSGGSDDAISSAGAGGGALLRSAVRRVGLASGSGHARARPAERYKNPCAAAVEENR